MSGPAFSLIIPTINRTKELAVLLNSLRQQEFKSFEVIIVDQNQDNRLSAIIANFESDLDLKHLRIEPRGASGARNAGLAVATGEILTFPDDDCYYPYDLLKVVNESFREPTLAGLCISSFDPQSGGKVARLAKSKTRIHTFNILKTVIEAGIFVRARVLGSNQFDEQLGVGAKTGWWSDEGPDLILPLLKAGHVFYFRPDLVIYHPDPVQEFNTKTILRAYNYGCGRGRFLRKQQFPFWFAFYVFALYIAGMGIGLVQFNIPKVKYYFFGLKGRVLGYYGKI